MFNPGAQLNWVVLCLLVILAAVICLINSRRVLRLTPALLLAPLPAFLFVHFMTPSPLDAAGASDAQLFGSFVALLTCYLPPALGATAAYIFQRPQTTIQIGTEIGHKNHRRRRQAERRPNLTKS